MYQIDNKTRVYLLPDGVEGNMAKFRVCFENITKRDCIISQWDEANSGVFTLPMREGKPEWIITKGGEEVSAFPYSEYGEAKHIIEKFGKALGLVLSKKEKMIRPTEQEAEAAYLESVGIIMDSRQDWQFDQRDRRDNHYDGHGGVWGF